MTYALLTKDNIEIKIYKHLKSAEAIIKLFPTKGYKVRGKRELAKTPNVCYK